MSWSMSLYMVVYTSSRDFFTLKISDWMILLSYYNATQIYKNIVWHILVKKYGVNIEMYFIFVFCSMLYLYIQSKAF